MNKLPYWLKVTIRIILLPCAFLLHLIPHVYGLTVNLCRWVRYGGEFITYAKEDAPTIGNIYKELKTKNYVK